jgi:hypothetical protein
MAVIYMSHSVHGTKVACLEAEAVYDEKNGWVRHVQKTPPQQEIVKGGPINKLEVKRRRSRSPEVVEQGA